METRTSKVWTHEDSEGEVNEPSSQNEIMARIQQYHQNEQDASMGYWRLVFSGVIENSRNPLEDTVMEAEDGMWRISAYF